MDTDPLTLLSIPARSDDLDAALSRRPRAKLPSLTLLLGALLVAGAGFLGGAMVGKHNAGSGSGAAALRGAFARAGATAGPGSGSGSGTGARAGRGLFGSGNATIGSIKLIDGSTVYVQTTSGAIVQVSTSPTTKITISSTGSLTDLRPGETVVVSGQAGKNGTVAATTINQGGLGGAGGFGGGGFGGGGAGAGVGG